MPAKPKQPINLKNESTDASALETFIWEVSLRYEPKDDYLSIAEYIPDSVVGDIKAAVRKPESVNLHDPYFTKLIEWLKEQRQQQTERESADDYDTIAPDEDDVASLAMSKPEVYLADANGVGRAISWYDNEHYGEVELRNIPSLMDNPEDWKKPIKVKDTMKLLLPRVSPEDKAKISERFKKGSGGANFWIKWPGKHGELTADYEVSVSGAVGVNWKAVYEAMLAKHQVKAMADDPMTETTILDVIDALHTGNGEAVTASSLGRVYQHVQDLDKQSFSMQTAWRHDKSDKENEAAMQELKSEVRKLGLGFTTMVGHWRECQDPNVEYEKCPPEKMVDSKEPSLFIPKISLKDAHALGKKFNQDAVLYGGPDAGGKIVLQFRTGGQQAIGKRFTPKAVGQAYTQLRKWSKAQRLTPDEYRKQNGKCPAGYEYDPVKKKCMKLEHGAKPEREFSLAASAVPVGWFITYATGSPSEAQAASVYEGAKYGFKLYNAVTGGALRR